MDDSLESVQINTSPIDQLSVAGSKIIGLSFKGERLFEWSTAGLNKLSFNKENKMLLRQDFQIKEYVLKPEFSQNIKLQSLPANRNLSGLLFDDIKGLS